MGDNFCSLPWTGIDINPQGGIKPCCKYKKNIAKDLDSYLLSPELDLLRQEFLAGQRPAGCQRCWDDEDAGLMSKRQIDHQYSLGGVPPALDQLKILSIGFGNTCNLACVTCGSFSSSKWSVEERRIDVTPWERIINEPSRYYRNTDLLQQLANMSDELVHLEIPGGEPFYTDKETHLKFLGSFRNPENIKIHYMTNATVFPEQEFWDIWKRFRAIDIQLSVDGIGDRFEYLRWPAKWSTVSDNIQRYRQQDIQLSISHTVSWLNILYADEFVSWCYQQDLPEPYLGPVSKPAYLDTRCLPPGAKSHIRNYLRHSKHQSVSMMLDYMDQCQIDQFDLGMRWVKTLDQQRGLEFVKIFPELNGFIQNN